MQNANDKQTQKFITMTQTPVKKLILKLGIPTIISMMITSLYNMADTFFVGQLSTVDPSSATSATAAVGIAFPLMAIIQAFGFMFGHGSGNFISRALGSQKTDEAEKMAATGFFGALIAGCCISCLGLLFLEPLVRLLGSTDTILPFAKDYIRLILIGCPWMAAALVLNNQLRFQGNALFGMIGITSGGIINIILDPIFIFALGLGVKGAALATITSQLISFSILLVMNRRSDSLKIHFKNFTPTPHYLAEMFKGGAPSLCRQGIGSINTAVLNNTAAAFGDPTIAAISIVNRIMMFANSIVIGLGQGFQPVCGFNYGAKKYARVREGFFFCVKCTTIFLFIASALFIAFAPFLVSLFRDDPEVILIGAKTLRIHSVAFPLFGYMMASSMMLQTTAQTFQASFLALARQGLYFMPLLLIFTPFLGLFGIQLAMPIADVLAFITAVVFQAKMLKKMKAQEQEWAEEASHI